ncbi:MAG: 3-deoxy-manno-octulosonate cytidylyltransferase [Pseudomonadota bacterium]
MKVAIVIPARLQSTRLSRKLLLDLGGKSILRRTYEQASKARRADSVAIATDAEEILEAARAFGARAILTRTDHQSGTERIAEAARSIDADAFINIQGDEPEIDPRHIDALIEAHLKSNRFAATLACPFPGDIDPSYPAAVKASLGGVIDRDLDIYEAKDFSRTPPAEAPLFLHVGAYAYSRESLEQFVAAPRGKREQAESLEQLRILEMGETIAIRIVDRAARGIDTEQDLTSARSRFAAKK